MKKLNKFLVGATAIIFFLSSEFIFSQSKKVLDDFSNISDWVINASDMVQLTPSLAQGKEGTALRLDYDFTAGSGYGGVQKIFNLKMPSNYQFSFDIKADSPNNTLEFKLIDKSGDNVWWVNLYNFNFPKEWTKLTFKKRNIVKAWGPLNLAKPDEVYKIEIIVTSVNGGKGTVYIDNLTFEEKEQPDTIKQLPIASASSFIYNNSAANACDNKLNTFWQSETTNNQYFQLNFKKTIETGGIKLLWDSVFYPSNYKVLISDDKITWDTVYTVTNGKSGLVFIPIKDCETSHIRLEFGNSSQIDYYKLYEIDTLPIEFGDTKNKMFEYISKNYPPGFFPKYFTPQKSYFTISGVPNDRKEALINEEGQIEVDKLSFSIVPLLYLNNKLITWNDVTTKQELADNYLPLPIVTWVSDEFDLVINLFTSGTDESSVVNASYTLINKSKNPIKGKLYLTFIPFQVNPSYQFLNTTGGVSKIEHISFNGKIISIDDKNVFVYPNKFNFGASTFDSGFITELIKNGKLPNNKVISDPQKLASAAAEFEVNLSTLKDTTIYVTIPFYLKTGLLAGDSNYKTYYKDLYNQVKSGWERLLNNITFNLPPEANKLINTIRSTIAYILINKDKHGFQPGSRSYERSWIRDGSMTSSTMLKFGLKAEVKDFITWYSNYQFPNGKIPCVVDSRGADPVPENDSHGEFIFAAYQYFLFTKDTLFLQNIYPKIVKTVDYIEELINQRSTEEYKTKAELKPYYGLVPESISHEGYSDKPMHSYWDNFFTIKGLKDAVEIAKVINNKNDVTRFTKLRDTFKDNLYNSINLAINLHHIDYIPGCVEKGDFDPTSTTVALYPCNEKNNLPQKYLYNTFNKYYEFFKDRRDNPNYNWQAYTPYEIRNAGAFLFLDEPDRTFEALEYFFKDQRPQGWNHWAEVVWRDYNLPRFIGDMPHTWVGSDFLTVARSIFVYENETNKSLVVGAGLREGWLESPNGISINNLITYYGKFSYAAHKQKSSYYYNLQGDLKIPDGGLVIKNIRRDKKPKSVIVNGKKISTFNKDEVIIKTLPANVIINY